MTAALASSSTDTPSARDDLASGDLAAGGLASPSQGPGPDGKRPKKAALVVAAPSRRRVAVLVEQRAGSGTMVALWVPPDVAAQLAIEGGEKADDLHVTLLYLGPAGALSEEQLAAAAHAVERVALDSTPLVGRVSGVGRFLGSEQDVVYASVDVPGLSAFREALAGAMREAGVPVAETHGFDPHITLAYVPAGAEVATAHVETHELAFNGVTFAVGGTRRAISIGRGADLATRAPAANPPVVGVSRETFPTQREDPRPSIREFRVDATGRRVRGPVYMSFDPQPGATYTVEQINELCDAWGTYITESDLRRLAERYMRWTGKTVDRMHDRDTAAGQLIASDVVSRDDATGDEYPTPTWIAGVYVLDPYRGDVATRKLAGYSIDVYAGRERIVVRVTGRGEVPDLTGVTKAPFPPNYVEVDGERTISIDRLVLPEPWGFSLVDRPAIRQEFTVQRGAPAETGAPILRIAPGEEPPALDEAAVQRGTVAYEATPEGADKEWDAKQAVTRLRSWAGVDVETPTAAAWEQYARGFLWFDGDKPESYGAYKLPHHDVEDDKLVLSRRGLAAAAQRLDAADMPEGDRDKARAHLTKHYHALGLDAPWETSEQKGAPDDDRPVTQGALRRLFAGLEARVAALFVVRRDLSALNPDGTPPAALEAALPPVVPVTEPEAPPAPAARSTDAPPEEAPVSTSAPSPVPAPVDAAPAMPPAALPAMTVRVTPLDKIAERLLRVRFAPPPAKPAGAEQRAEDTWTFASLWEQQEVYTNLSSMWQLLGDIVWSRVFYGPEIEKPEDVDAILTAIARDCTEFLAELRELLEFEVAEQEGMTVEARGARRLEARLAARDESIDGALALFGKEPLARLYPVDDVSEQRAGKKYSKATIGAMKQAMEGVYGAYQTLKAMVDEAEGAGAEESGEGDEGDEAALEQKKTPAVVVPPAPSAAQREVQALERQARQQAEEIAALQRAGTEPAPAATPAPAEDARLTELRAQVARNAEQLAALKSTRRPSAQPSGTTPPAAAPAIAPPDMETLQRRWQQQAAYGAGATTEGRG